MAHGSVRVIELPEVHEYAVVVDNAADTLLYIGEALSGSSQTDSVWRIRKVDLTSGVVITWADGDTNFDNDWSQRILLTYL